MNRFRDMFNRIIRWLRRHSKALELMVAAGVLVALGLNLYLASAEHQATETETSAEEDDAVVFVTEYYDDAAQLSENSGLPTADLKNLPFTPEESLYEYQFEELAQISYYDGEGEAITYRISRGTEDNSGDYQEYDQIEEVEVSGKAVRISGTEDLYYLAIWTDGTYAYSIGVSNGVSKDVLLAMIP